MRGIFFFLWAVLLHAVCHAQDLMADNKDEWLKELRVHVKKITSVYLFDGKQTSKQVMLFDTINNEVTDFQYNDQDSLTLKTMHKYIYDQNRKIVEEDNDQSWRGTGTKISLSKTLFRYDGKGNLVEKKEHSSPQQDWENINLYAYDSNNINISEAEYTTGNRIVDSTKTHDQDTSYKYSYKYDNKGNKIETKKYYACRKTITPDVAGETYLYKFDDRNEVIEQKCYTDFVNGTQQYRSTTIFKYDNAGHLLEESNDTYLMNIAAKSGFTQIIYEYDTKGIWTKCTVISGAKNEKTTTSVEEREIQYY